MIIFNNLFFVLILIHILFKQNTFNILLCYDYDRANTGFDSNRILPSHSFVALFLVCICLFQLKNNIHILYIYIIIFSSVFNLKFSVYNWLTQVPNIYTYIDGTVVFDSAQQIDTTVNQLAVNSRTQYIYLY